MRGVDFIYLGWANPRQAFTFPNLAPDQQLVVLINGQLSATLHGFHAVDFRNHIRELTHHLTGVKRSDRMAALVAKTDDITGAYNAIFDDYWRSA